MTEKAKVAIRIILTALVLFVGGYFIQKSVSDITVSIADADIPVDPGDPGDPGPPIK